MHSIRQRAVTALHIRPVVQSPLTTPPPPRIVSITCRRHFHLEGLALAPLYFGGLFVALWTWKCCMLVTFQNKIIYMPGLPPNARSEKIEDYASRCAGISWREERIRAADGNASSTPPRLPDISSTLAMLKRNLHDDSRSVRLTFVCLSYRGYWTSKGRPTEKGIRLDALSALDWISRQHRNGKNIDSKALAIPTDRTGRLVLWGQSIGAGVATNLAAEASVPQNLELDSIILETPFTSIRAMLEVLYPQKWLPYKYLWPFLRNQLDSWKNFGLISERYYKGKARPRMLILEAAKDELVPAALSQKLYDRAEALEIPVERKAVESAFHNDTMFRAEGRRAVSDFLARRIRE
ncbi:hypothetical protein PFICI_07160 [Pestalotiopsis fici W106-1]|uniref:AB hydrolase-1 domain-containing protein n=1 Tax=Pestalotiopsis fici (strain W106-1 / CGMCC3.15140) TaxID=1229662 RepID=W3X7Q8_PESFW|nr:uncharacterized protein PFICI_07160 [Pestalotiopsis fici W106-1]ETS82158.1 hypothetical protein PFICI_07160 [Pestalotiopsis fici W106-1]